MLDDRLQMMDVEEEVEEEEEVPALVGLAAANNDEGPLRSATTQLPDSSLAKVPLTIVTGTRLSSWKIREDVSKTTSQAISALERQRW